MGIFFYEKTTGYVSGAENALGGKAFYGEKKAEIGEILEEFCS